MHLIPRELRSRRILEGERVCEAIAAVGSAGELSEWADRFAQLSDPRRLALLLAIAHAGPICVSDLAVATDMSDTAVSQALRLLRASGTVVAHREGKMVRYELSSYQTRLLLDHLTDSTKGRRRATS